MDYASADLAIGLAGFALTPAAIGVLITAAFQPHCAAEPADRWMVIDHRRCCRSFHQLATSLTL